MSTTTTNYGLIKPGTDDPILVGQLNDNMDTIDAALKENADAIENKPDAADIPTPSTAAPAMDGTAAAGTSTDYARSDHVHPSDTSKQDALTAAQLAAVNSGIDSAKVEQIETNKNNILFVSKNGAANYAKVGTNSYVNNGITVTGSNGVVTISGTANGTFSLYIGGKITDDIENDNKLTSKLPDVISFTGAPNTDNKNRMIFALYNGSTWVYSGSTNDLYHDLTGKVYTYWLLYIPIISGNQYNGVWKPMIVPKSLYDSGFTNYQPYAMSNAELTAAIQALQAQLANQ